MRNYKSNPAKTMLTISMGFIIMFLFADWDWALKVALVIGLLGVFSTFLSEKVEWLWMKLAFLLSLFVPKVLLIILFYLFLFPIALLSKLFTKSDNLMLINGRESTFSARKKEFDKADFEKIW